MKTDVNIPELQDLLARVDQALEMVETMITNAELIFADLQSKKQAEQAESDARAGERALKEANTKLA